MWRRLALWLTLSFTLWCSAQACFLGTPAPCNPHDPNFDIGACSCSDSRPCPLGMRCVAGTCTQKSDGGITQPDQVVQPPERGTPDLLPPPDRTKRDQPSPDRKGPDVIIGGENQPDARPDAQPDAPPTCQGKTRPCYKEASNTIDVGLCKAGTETCQNGVWGDCLGAVMPQPEICDGKDNNCDSKVDEGCKCITGEKQACGKSNVLPCKQGTQICNKAGEWDPCFGEVKSAPEVCDGKDNNCDGQVDNGLKPRACYSGPTGSMGKGPCKGGTQTCSRGTWGTCTGEITPKIEVCDGKDNDCDGQVDNGLKQRACYSGPTGSAGKGPCKAGIQICNRGMWTTCTGEHTPTQETCDGIDENCDGIIDNLIASRECITSNSGRTCRSGTQLCSKGQWGLCTGELRPASEICGNNKDDDCDGRIDETCSSSCTSRGVRRSCGSKNSPCKQGSQECGPTYQWSTCTGDVGPTVEICDGVDNDCNGTIDDNVAPHQYAVHFTITSATKFDFLWVYDTTFSMRSHRSNISNAISTFTDRLKQLAADYQIGIITVDTALRGALQSNPLIITKTTANPSQAISQVINGPTSQNDEDGLASAKRALSSSTSTNRGFLRTDAMLVLLFISDEHDQSNDTTSSYIQFFQGLKTKKDLLHASVIGHDLQRGCRTTSTSQCRRYYDVMQALGGSYHNIEKSTAKSIAKFLLNMVDTTAGGGQRFQLNAPPNTSSFVITINGHTIPPSPTNGWSYNSSNNEIQFTGTALPQAGDRISIFYKDKCTP